jgi:tRNA-dihydrouridine synthase
MGKPWIIEDIERHLSGLPPIERTSLDYRETFLEHLEHIASYQIERRAVADLRRVGCWYLKQGKGTRQLREALNRSKTVNEIRAIIESFNWLDAEFTSVSIHDECEVSC